MPKIFRVMKADETDKPLVGDVGSCLGVRVPSDIAVDAAGNVQPGTGGLSVSPFVGAIGETFLPNRLKREGFPRARGSNSNFVWSMGEGLFVEGEISDKLVLRLDPEDNLHGFIEPAQEMSLDEYQAALAATLNEWHKEAL